MQYGLCLAHFPPTRLGKANRCLLGGFRLGERFLQSQTLDIHHRVKRSRTLVFAHERAEGARCAE